MPRRLLAAAMLLLAACAAPVRNEMTIDLREGDGWATVSVDTHIDTKARGEAAQQRAAAARSAILAGTDEWTHRFERLDAESEQFTLHKRYGVIERATRSARLPAADLQDVFGDLSVTVHYLQGDDWTELAFYPATSTRASREQRQHVEQALLSWSEAVTAYLGAIRHLYAYMDDHPERAQPLFAAILGERVEVALLPLTDEEEPMADAVVAAMEEIAVRMDGEEARAIPLAEEVDMVFNPFPARVVVALPHEILTASGFTQIDSTSVAIEPIDLTTTLRELEGEWLSPDPLAALLRDETPTAADLAARERSAKIVTEPEVSELLRAAITRPRHHIVRWRH